MPQAFCMHANLWVYKCRVFIVRSSTNHTPAAHEAPYITTDILLFQQKTGPSPALHDMLGFPWVFMGQRFVHVLKAAGQHQPAKVWESGLKFAHTTSNGKVTGLIPRVQTDTVLVG